MGREYVRRRIGEWPWIAQRVVLSVDAQGYERQGWVLCRQIAEEAFDWLVGARAPAHDQKMYESGMHQQWEASQNARQVGAMKLMAFEVERKRLQTQP
jgi:hypothetical protein